MDNGVEQKNYFTYNIIDALYYNQPTDLELEKIYGINRSFKRRSSSGYDKMTPEQQNNYNELEKLFIQAVINKYTIDDYNNTSDHTIGTYIGNLDEPGLEDISYAYLNSKKEIGIELSDMVTNINGTHNYKLISAKDIDFDNVILPNSAIERDFNWGTFDNNRRWGDKPIRINNTFELLNVIDYLLCACDNLWNELYKIKYSVNDNVQIWFTKDVSDDVLIHSTYKLVSQDFQLNSEGRTSKTRMITYLDPMKYYTSLNNNVDNQFGIVTNFYTTPEEEGLTFDRKVVDIRNQNIILMVILPNAKEIGEYISSATQNIEGQLQQIYAYRIGDELKIYPGSRIDSFINENNVTWDPNDLIDFKNKKLKNETYFKIDSEHAIYTKVYVKFLDVKQLNISLNEDDVKNPYFIYYINNDNKKVIIAYNYENSENVTSSAMRDQLVLKIQNVMTTYEIPDFSNYSFTDQVYKNDDTGLVVPKFYIISDEFYTTLEVATPNSKLWSAGTKSITIYYYKNRNKLDCTITRQKDGNPISILPEEDLTQSKSLAYHGFRYNIPDGQEITFKFDASYIALDNSSEGNPLGIKLDDEYYDIMFYGYDSITTDEQAGQYYKLSGVESSGGLFNRNFEQFTKNTFESNKSNYVSSDVNGYQYKHVWKKQDNPYKLNLTIDNDEFITQSLSRQDVIDEINIIKNQNELRQTTYNTYILNHTLTDGIEQIKMDLRFSIDETSKVKAVECIIPININKIYNPTINYYTKSGITLENKNYSNIFYKTADNTTNIRLSDMYDASFNKYDSNSGINSIPDIGKYMYGSDLLSLEEFGEQKTYDCQFNNSSFEFTYSNTANIVNLIGGWYTEKYVSTYIKNGKQIANTRLLVNNNPVVLKNDTGDSANNHLYIFNFNGFGRNYRLHGGGNFVSDAWKSNVLDVLKPWFPQFDLLSVSTFNNYGSINKQLKVKIDDVTMVGNQPQRYQLTNICVSKNSDDEEVWTTNTGEFNSGLNKKIGETNNDNPGDYYQPQQEEQINDYIIKTLPVDIVKTSYQMDCNITFLTNEVNNEYMTYYLPLAYMYINSSTFWPPVNTIPSGNVPDLNDSVELEKYGNYVQCWKSEDYYRPITLSLKLFDNTTITNPYYYESNEAIMKFNIKRSQATQSVTIEGTSNIIYVSLNSKYYLSDFIRIGSINENSVIVNDGENSNQNNTSILSSPSGSYFYYDDTYRTHVIAEIPANFKHNSFSDEHNAHYKYFNGVNKSNLLNPDIITGNTNIQKIAPYPIFRKEVIKNNETVFSPTSYNYDIYRVSDINKINMNQSTTFVTNVIFINNESGENATTVSSLDALGITSHADTYSVDIEPEFVNNFADLKGGDGSTFNMILYKVKNGGLIGSKNYLGADASTEGTITKVSPIIRKKNTDYPFNELNLYYTVNYSGPNLDKRGIYEFFEFKYENIYEIKKTSSQGNIDIYEITSIAPIPQSDNSNNGGEESLTCEEAYDKQLELFLANDPNDFIGTIEFYENHFNNQPNDQSGDEQATEP